MSIATCSRCGHAAPSDARHCPKCGATLGSRPRGGASTRFQQGDVIDGRYEVIERLPGGGMGELYKVRHVHLGEYRVIKLLRADQLADDTQRKRFFQEARIAASIKHPNVGLLHDFASLADGTFYMVEEFIDGVTISRSLRAGRRFSLGEIVDITRQVLLGLVAIHEKGIIHRDISPDNLILCQRDGALEVRIIDLGIAKPIVPGEGQALTSAGLFVGKPHYASPEQMRMIETDEVIDHRSDIYSLGVVIYELIVGKVPFEAATPLAYLLKQISEDIDTVNRDVSGVVPRDLDAFIVRMLKTKRDERFATARDALRALDEAVAGIPHLLFRAELGHPPAEESFPRVTPKPRKEGTDEIPFEQLAAIIRRERGEDGDVPEQVPLASTDDDDTPATEVQSMEGLMTTTQQHERVGPPVDTVEAPAEWPDSTMPATTPLPPEAPRGKYSPVAIAAICVAFLLVVPTGGWLFYRLLDSRLGTQQAPAEQTTPAPTVAASSATPSTAPGPAPAPRTATASAPSDAPGTATAASATAARAEMSPTPQPPPRTPTTRQERRAAPPPPAAPEPVAAAVETASPSPPPTETVEPPTREGDIVAPGEGVVDAQIARKVEPMAPPSFAVMGNRGFAMFSVLVATDGTVESARLIRSSGSEAFDDLATAAAKKATFKPATKDGIPVRMWRTLRYDVKVRGTM